jgi:TrpR family trp operon transcriptional repressor
MQHKELEDLIKHVQSLHSQDEIEDFLQGILTPKELKEISMRFIIVRMLKAGISQHQIAKDLGVGIATVTRGSKEIKKGRFSSMQPIDRK